MRRRGIGARFVRGEREGGFGVLDRKFVVRECGTRRMDRKGEGIESSKITKFEASTRIGGFAKSVEKVTKFDKVRKREMLTVGNHMTALSCTAAKLLHS